MREKSKTVFGSPASGQVAERRDSSISNSESGSVKSSVRVSAKQRRLKKVRQEGGADSALSSSSSVI